MATVARDPTSAERGAIETRRATVDDIATVVELRLALLREYGDHPVYGRLRPEAERIAKPFFQQQLTAPDQAMFLAVSDRIVVGIARCVDTKGSPLLMPDRYCYVTSVYVKPEHRRQGVLSALIETIEDWAHRRGLTELRLHNSTESELAQTAWEQLGFAVNEEVRLKQIRR